MPSALGIPGADRRRAGEGGAQARPGDRARRRDDERVNPPQDERQRLLERSVLALAGVAMFAAALAGMVWELASGLPLTELRATAVLLAGAVTAMVSEQVLHRRT